MSKNNEVRFRVHPMLMEAFTEISARHGLSPVEVYRAFTRHLVGSCDMPKTTCVSRESQDTQSFLDRELAELYFSGLSRRGKDLEFWISEKTIEAHASKFEAGKNRYYIFINKRTLGPYRLDKLREWVALEVIPGSTHCASGDWRGKLSEIPKFEHIPILLKRKLANREKEPKKDWKDDPATVKQVHRLDFFDIPYQKEGLSKGRAHELITHFNFIDPEKEKEYNLWEKNK